MTAASVYTTTDDEHEARVTVERLWYERNRKALVMRVNDLVRCDGIVPLVNPLALRTTNRYAVIAELK